MRNEDISNEDKDHLDLFNGNSDTPYNENADSTKDSIPSSNWDIDQLTNYAKDQLHTSGQSEEESILQSHKSAVALFRAGSALKLICEMKKMEKHGAWKLWKDDNCLKGTTVNDAIRLYKNAETEDALKGMGITEAKTQFVYPSKDDQLDDDEESTRNGDSENSASVPSKKTKRRKKTMAETAPNTVAPSTSGTSDKCEQSQIPDQELNTDSEGSDDEHESPTDDGVGDESDEEESEPTTLLDYFRRMTDSFTEVLPTMEDLDWSKEDEEAWIETNDSLKNVIDEIVGKIQKSFKESKPKSKKSKPNVPETEITIKKLNSLYGHHGVQVLNEYLEELEKEDGAMRRYRIVKPLPSVEEYKEIQRQRYTSTVAELVAAAFTDFEDLASDVGDWYDNLPEAFQSGDLGSTLESTRDTLGSISQPNVPKTLGEMSVYYLPIQNASSRASRRDDAVGCLQAVVEVLEEVAEDDEVRCLIGELENAISEAEGVDFPGMYGN